MKLLITADLHLTTKRRDEYRWGVFDKLKYVAKKKNVDGILILGDITHDKDNHCAALVNRAADAMFSLSTVCPLTILKGNHDYTDPATPFFRFVNGLTDDRFSPVRFIAHPECHEIKGVVCGFLPHTSNWRTDWALLMFLKDARWVFIHQAIAGARVVGEHALSSGVPSALFDDITLGRVIAGDVHVPQRIGKVTYCGSPHPINFGDDHDPRFLLIKGDALKSVPIESIRKWSLCIGRVEELDDYEMSKGDQVKIQFTLPKSEFVDWRKHRDEAERKVTEAGAELCGVELKQAEQRKRLRAAPTKTENPVQLLKHYAESQKLDNETLDWGHTLIKEITDVRTDAAKPTRQTGAKRRVRLKQK